EYRQEFLLELLRCKGRLGNPPSVCPTCGKDGEPVYWCAKCLPGHLECQSCCVECHRQMPLHVIFEWAGSFFDKTLLKELGLHVQLGHNGQTSCLKPQRGPNGMIVIHTNGIHEVSVNYCDCQQHLLARQQLLRFGWYPATVHQPNTCLTIDCLELFHSLTLMGKLSAYDFYKSLTYLTDASGLLIAKSRYKSFLRMVWQWRHLLMLLRGGKGCEANRASNVGPGELAMECPACPNPGVNLHEGWESAPPEIQ
ncbi:hypothetical protein EV421DRAFT_1716371, partial [Armillaria borealis]